MAGTQVVSSFCHSDTPRCHVGTVAVPRHERLSPDPFVLRQFSIAIRLASFLQTSQGMGQFPGEAEEAVVAKALTGAERT